ncbi:MAG: radical SAM protein [Methanobacteriaceae archaeon]
MSFMNVSHFIDKINNFEVLELVNKANKVSLAENYKNITLERAIFLSWWCDKGDCSFCYMSTQKNKIKDPKKAKRRLEGILAEAELCERLGWNIEFLSGGYDSYTTEEIKSIAKKIYNITNKPVWLNTGITNDLESYYNDCEKEIIGITGALEVANPKLHNELCPSKSIEDISDMLDTAGNIGFKKAITIILGLGETPNDLEYLVDYIKNHNIDRVIFYSLNPHKGTIFEKSSQPASMYYAGVVASIRILFPKIEIICGTWIDNLANIGILIQSGANGITKFPMFKMFGTRYGKRVEEEVKWAGRSINGTFTDTSKLGSFKSKIDSNLDNHIHRYIKESLENKY